MKPKVQILTTCAYCQGEAYLPDHEAVSNTGERYIQHEPCPVCHGNGRAKVWIELNDLLDLLSEADQRDPMEPDWAALAEHRRWPATRGIRAARRRSPPRPAPPLAAVLRWPIPGCPSA